MLPAPATGDFGSELLSIFAQENAATFSFSRMQDDHEGEEYVFDFHIPAGRNHAFTYREDGAETHPDLRGTLWVSKDTNEVRRLDVLATNIDKAFSADHVLFSIGFGKERFGEGGEFLLPMQSESTICTRRQLGRHNLTEWQNCRKLGVKTRIILGVE